MSDYTVQASWGTKNALATGEALKAISATELGTEFSAIATAILSKLDNTDFASSGEAEALTSPTKIITPDTLNDVLVQLFGSSAEFNFGSGVVSLDIDALDNVTPVSGDEFVMADASASGAPKAVLFSAVEAALNHDSLTGFVANEHINHTSVSITAGDGLTGGGDISATRNLAVGAGAGITVSADAVALTNVTAGAAQPVNISSGTFTFPLTQITEITGAGLTQSEDKFLVSDNGTLKVMPYDEMGLLIQAAQTTQTLAAADMNTIMEFDGTATLTIPANATTALPIGACVVIVVDHATQQVTVQAASGVTLNSIWHPGGSDGDGDSDDSDKVRAGGTALLIKTGTNDWYLTGDTLT